MDAAAEDESVPLDLLWKVTLEQKLYEDLKERLHRNRRRRSEEEEDSSTFTVEVTLHFSAH